MKQWEQRLREEQRLTLPRRLAYAVVGFGVGLPFGGLALWGIVHFGGEATSWREFVESADGRLALIPLGVLIFFTLYGFCRGDRVLDLHRRLRNDYSDRPADDDDLRR